MWSLYIVDISGNRTEQVDVSDISDIYSEDHTRVTTYSNQFIFVDISGNQTEQVDVSDISEYQTKQVDISGISEYQTKQGE